MSDADKTWSNLTDRGRRTRARRFAWTNFSDLSIEITNNGKVDKSDKKDTESNNK